MQNQPFETQSGENSKRSDDPPKIGLNMDTLFFFQGNKDLFDFEEDQYYHSSSEKNQSEDWSAKVEIGISPQVQWEEAQFPTGKSLFIKTHTQLMGFQDSTNLSEKDKIEAEFKGEQAREEYLSKIKMEEEMAIQRQLIADEIDPIINKWAFKNDVRNNLRTLIASLHTITWEGSGWKYVDFMDIIEDNNCLLYTSDAADEEDSVDLGGCCNIQNKKERDSQL
eukprot:TRINITY_DN8776_c0_g1_i5.p3 TRINITY_DN8776_c0_g1~~TRINITY_DN8776_c0_g1_i5.p3  ORF type:complete len:223 (-),score=40.80 TRINITY_DN8776_c0_g1_i5:25-693(-)